MIPKGLLRNVILMSLAGVSGVGIAELTINHGVIRFGGLAGGLIGGAIGGWLKTAYREAPRHWDQNKPPTSPQP